MISGVSYWFECFIACLNLQSKAKYGFYSDSNFLRKSRFLRSVEME